MDFGAQMWGYNKLFRNNPEDFLAKMEKYGYRIIEPDILIDESITGLPMPVWTLDELDGFYALVKKYGMRLDSVHVFGDVLTHLDAMKDWKERYGIRAVIHSLDNDQSAELNAANCLKEADALAVIGLELWLHNGGQEVRAAEDGESLLEKTLKLCGGKVFSQLDVGWALYGGQEPAAYTEKLSPYLRSVHYKDLTPGYETLPFPKLHIGLGRGALDVKACWNAAKGLNVTHILDQDDSELDMMEDARTGLLLMKYLEVSER